MAEILIIEDDQAISQILSRLSHKIGHKSTVAHTLADGLAQAAVGDKDIILLDLKLPDGSGLDLLPSLVGMAQAPEVIIITGTGNTDGAELAFKYGAWDYLQKPFKTADVALAISRALQFRDEREARKTPMVLDRAGIVGESPQIKSCLEHVAQAAGSNAPVLITGQTGTGKELFARSIHQNSVRAENNFVVVDCTVLPQNLVESALFGHVRGAFTGAGRDKDGLIKQAHGGTLFLDEVGELPPATQKSFLRVLQEHRFRPVGDEKEITSDFRLVTATNRDLNEMCSEGSFREDLLFRLNSITIGLPPLIDRSGDIKALIFFYLSRLAQDYSRELKGMSPEFLDALSGYDWPGNVRELFSSLEGAFAAAGNHPTLYPKHLSPHIRVHAVDDPVKQIIGADPANQDIFPDAQDLPSFQDFRQSVIQAAEAGYMQDLMIKSQGSRQEARRISGLSQSRLYALLKKYNTPRFRNSGKK